MTLDPTKIPVPVEGDWLGVRRAFQVIRQFFSEVSTAIFADAASDGDIYGRKDAAWAEITPAGIGASASNHTHTTSDFAKIASAPNVFELSQTVEPQIIASMSGTVTWNLEEAQNAEIEVIEEITGWTISDGVAGQFLSLRLSANGINPVAWPSASFKNMTDFELPGSGQVSILSFRCRTASILEFMGQSPAFDEWGA